MEYHKKYDDRKALTKNTVYSSIVEFNSYLYDDTNQYESTATANITDLIINLVTGNIINENVSKIK